MQLILINETSHRAKNAWSDHQYNVLMISTCIASPIIYPKPTFECQNTNNIAYLARKNYNDNYINIQDCRLKKNGSGITQDTLLNTFNVNQLVA